MSVDRFKLKLSKLFTRNRSEREKYLLSYIDTLIDEREEANHQANDRDEWRAKAESLYRDNEVMAGVTQERSNRVNELEAVVARKDHKIDELENALTFTKDQIAGYTHQADEAERKFNSLNDNFNERLESEINNLENIHQNRIAEIRQEYIDAGIQFEDVLSTEFLGRIATIANYVNNHKGTIKKSELSAIIIAEHDKESYNKARSYFEGL